VTVVAWQGRNPERGGCCDTRSTLWNRICRDLAREELSRAQGAVAGSPRIDFRVLVAPVRDVVGRLTREALARGADEIVVADPRGSGLGRLERRRLRRVSAVRVFG
jgi:hypothetical protein